MTRRTHKMRLSLLIGMAPVVFGLGAARLSSGYSGACGEAQAVVGEARASRSAAVIGQDRPERRHEKPATHPARQEIFVPRTRVSLRGSRWCINGELTNRGTRA